MLFRIFTWVIHKSIGLCTNFENLLQSEQGITTLSNNYFNNALNKDDDMSNHKYARCVAMYSHYLPLAKQVQMCEMYAYLPLFFCFLVLLMLHSNEELLYVSPLFNAIFKINSTNILIPPPNH